MLVRETRYLDEAIGWARACGLFEHTQVRLTMDLALPEWIKRFQAVDGFAGFERENAVVIPAVLREFWSIPELVCAWSVAQVDALGEVPSVEEWGDGIAVLTVDMHWHSGCAAGVLLDGSANPPAVLEFEPDKPYRKTFSGYLEDGFKRFARRIGLT